VPLLPGAREHALDGSFGGLERNIAHFVVGGRVRFEGVDDVMRTLMLDPQTSGGLLVAVPAAHRESWDGARKSHGVDAARVGEVVEGEGVTVTA
jgi:selenide,water dikinase